MCVHVRVHIHVYMYLHDCIDLICHLHACTCTLHVFSRENAVTPQVERDAHLTQTYWMEIRHIVKKIYREKLSLTSKWREGGERGRERGRGKNSEKDDKERGRREREVESLD